MRKMILIAGLLAVLLPYALGQEQIVVTKIPFEFVAGGKTMPAGTYSFTISSVSSNLVQIKNQETRKTDLVTIMTRVGSDKTAEGTARIAFDVIEGKHVLEAVWPEQGDGYLLHIAKGEHGHEIVRPTSRGRETESKMH